MSEDCAAHLYQAFASPERIICVQGSVVKVLFHDRRLQFMEKEHLTSWKQTRPGERILNIDIPLSYGLVSIHLDPIRLNQLEFVWDPTKETGIYVRVHCISTEFTAKKHGGEKGVPFRIQVETYTNTEEAKLLHVASCQIKVFKPKGADRKHKTDREKMERRSDAEKEKYQPSYVCTVMTEVPKEHIIQANAMYNKSQMLSDSYPDLSPSPQTPSFSTASNTSTRSSPFSPTQTHKPEEIFSGSLPVDAHASQVAQWLQCHRFSNYVPVFQNFSGADILRLTRNDLIEICGLADGIRLDNALQARHIRPRLTIYVCQEPESIYHAVYLESLILDEFKVKLSSLFGIQKQQIGDVYIQGPSQIHILLTDEVLQNTRDQARFVVEGMKDESGDKYRIFLRRVGSH